MKYKPILLLLILSFKNYGQSNAFYPKAQKLIGVFSVYHYQPIQRNEKTSQEIIELFIKELDRDAFILKAPDCSLLRKDNSQVLNEIALGKDNYFESAKRIYLQALNVTDSVLKNLSNKKIDLSKTDTITYNLLNNDKINYAANTKVYSKKLETIIKFLSFNLVSNAEDFEKMNPADFQSKVQAAYTKIINNYQKKIQAEIKTCDHFVASSLLNAIALRHDPHSNYFTEEQNKAFNSGLSSQIETFGFYLDETDDGQIFIADIDPGGPAWLSNEINNSDNFVSVKIGNELLTGEELSASDIQEKMNVTKFNKIVLTIRKQNRILKTVALIKQKIASSENNVKGYVLKENNKKTGYISLPSFYTDMDEHNKPGCANDVAKEILKLENDSIQGLIIDLRNNGGGSMEEAMNLAGIFIDEGPLFILKEKNRKPTLIKDLNRGSIFKKPLVVIINEGSASASELFSNIIKDYNAGIVVGQKSYGKGTAQNVLPLDTNLLFSKNKNAINNNADFIKITNAKFYRLNCSTHQGSGVIPDIAFPALPGYSHIGESKEAYFLSSDTIIKKVMYQPFPPINIIELKNNSVTRISNSHDFKKFNHLRDSIGIILNKEQKIILNLAAFKNFKNNTETLYKIMDNISKTKNSSLTCLNNNFDKQLEEVNEQSKEFNAKILNSIQSDIFIIESNAIIHNLINQPKKQ